MFEIAVFCAIVALCSAYVPVNVENEWYEIRKILIHQEKGIQKLKSENRDLRADMANMKRENRDLRADIAKTGICVLTWQKWQRK